MTKYFDNILIWALPASGKSEVMAFLRGLSQEQRDKLNIGSLVEIDDYPLVAASFEIDDARQRSDKQRLLTREQTHDEGGFLDPGHWDTLDHHLCLRYEKVLFKDPNVHTHSTILLECARGGPADAAFPLPHGYGRTLENLPRNLIEKAVILYVKVPPEEARRKNDARYDPKDPHGILSHRVPTSVMLNDYGCDDVARMIEQGTAQGHEGYVKSAAGIWVPIGVLDNTTDLTSFVRERDISPDVKAQKTRALFAALEATLSPLFERYTASRPAV